MRDGATIAAVVPAKAGTHSLRCFIGAKAVVSTFISVVMGPRFRGDDSGAWGTV